MTDNPDCAVTQFETRSDELGGEINEPTLA